MVSRSLPFWELIWSAEAYPSGTSYGQPKITLLAAHMVSRSLPFVHRPSIVSPHDSSSTGSFPRLFRSQISPHESSSTVSLPRLFRSHISTSIMTKNAPMQRKFNFGEDENHSFGIYRLTGRRRTTQTSGKEARMLS